MLLDAVQDERRAAPGARRTAWPLVLVHTAWVTLLAAFVVARVGRFGFNPSDQGFVLSLAWRLLDGDIPHVDVHSPRPLGSGVLHVVDFLLPAPLFVSSAFVAMVEIIVATIACAALITRTSPLRWGPLRTGLVAAAALVNLHTFILMAWHTIDGIFLVSVGWWLIDTGVRADSATRRRVGLFLLGFAAMCKQSFVFAAPVGIALLLWHPERHTGRRDGRWWGRFTVDLLCLGAFPLAYMAVVTAAGGLSGAIEQLTGATGAWGENLYAFWSDPFAAVGDIRRHILMVAGCALVAAVAWALRSRLGRAAPWVRFVPVAGAAVVTVYALVRTELTYPASWAVKLLWIFVVVALLDAVVHRRLPWRALMVVGLAYMSSLSWGYIWPGLLAGTLVLGTLDLLVRCLPDLRVTWRPVVVRVFVGAAAVALAGIGVVREHDRAPAADLPQGELTADLGGATPAMRWIRTNPVAYRYIEQIGDCVRRYPAGKVAVFSDNAFAYPAFELHNPFPVPWPIPLELVADARERMLGTVDRLNREGDYLVLFQTVRTHGLRTPGGTIPDRVSPDAPIVQESGLEEPIRAGLTGQRVSCGSFVGVWARS